MPRRVALFQPLRTPVLVLPCVSYRCLYKLMIGLRKLASILSLLGAFLLVYVVSSGFSVLPKAFCLCGYIIELSPSICKLRDDRSGFSNIKSTFHP